MAFRAQIEGLSVHGEPLWTHYAGPERKGGLLLLGGTHGDERASIDLLKMGLAQWDSSESTFAMSPNLPLAVMPCVNPDGYAQGSRYNARGVDLNRNFPAGWSRDSLEPAGEAPLSEPESRILHDLILRLEPSAIVSLHWALAEIDGDGAQSVDLVNALWDALPEEDKPTYRKRYSLPKPGNGGVHTWDGPPGSLGRWAGHELKFASGRAPAMVTLELPYGVAPFPRPEVLPEDHLETVSRHYSGDRERYLAYTFKSLAPMLSAACNFVESSLGSPKWNSAA